MNRKLQWVLVVALAMVVVGTAAAAPRQVGALTASVGVASYWHGLDNDVALTFTLTNASADSVFVLRWQTPIDDLEADLFEVQRDGRPVPYTGKLVKRPAPELDDYVEIPAGGSLTVTFDPSSAYDMTVRGQYTLRYRVQFQDMLVPVADAPGTTARAFVPRLLAPVVESNAATMWVEGDDPSDEPTVPELSIQAKGGKKPPSGGGGEFTSCTTTQQNTLKTAKSNATMISGKAISYLNGGSDTDGLYRTWFDYYGTANNGWNTAKTHFSSINGAFQTAPVTFDCSCKQRYYAYVYPSQPYKIYLCSVFWSAPNLGTDSKAGTLVHEMSHFNVVAGTDDYVYGTSGAQNLARTDPAKALNNADNHEYFAEHQK